MPAVLKNNSPSTYEVKFFEPTDKFTVYDSRGNVYFYRLLPRGCKGIKLNIPDPGNYSFSKNAAITRKPLSIAREIYRIKLPPYERHRQRNYIIVHDDKEVDSPAIIYTTLNPARIVTGRKFKGLPIPMGIFILLHELGHMRYKTEKYCDLFAFVELVRMGYNPSTAMYCLTDQLRRNARNDERINYLYSKMKEAEIIKL